MAVNINKLLVNFLQKPSRISLHLLLKDPSIPHRTKVSIAYKANNLIDETTLDLKIIEVRSDCLNLIKKWLIDPSKVDKRQLKSAYAANAAAADAADAGANAAYAAAYAAADAAAYAAYAAADAGANAYADAWGDVKLIVLEELKEIGLISELLEELWA